MSEEKKPLLTKPMSFASATKEFTTHIERDMSAKERFEEKEWLQVLKMIKGMRDDLDDHYAAMQKDFDELEYRLGGESRYLGLDPEPEPSRLDRVVDVLYKPWLTRFIFIISFLWQVINLLVLEFVYTRNVQDINIAIAVMAITQSIMVVWIILVSFKLVADVLNRSLSLWFIIQSYLSTIMLFAGIYLLVHRIDATSFSGLDPDDGTKLRAVLFYVDFLNFSCGIMSAGISKVGPVTWFAELIVSAQMLIGMIYWCVILGSGVDHVISLTPLKPEEKKGRTVAINDGSSAPVSTGTEPLLRARSRVGLGEALAQ